MCQQVHFTQYYCKNATRILAFSALLKFDSLHYYDFFFFPTSHNTIFNCNVCVCTCVSVWWYRGGVVPETDSKVLQPPVMGPGPDQDQAEARSTLQHFHTGTTYTQTYPPRLNRDIHGRTLQMQSNAKCDKGVLV